MKLMLIDDESATRNGLLKHISWLSLGIDQLKVMSDARRALEVCATWLPEIILSDVRMPEMDGITLCWKVREQNPNCQIIFISGYADKEALLAAIGLGAVSFVEKPIELPKLEAAIRKAVSKSLEKDRHFFDRRVLEQNFPLIEMEVVENLIGGQITGEIEKNLEIFNLRKNYQVILIRSAREFESRASLGSCVLSNLNGIFSGISYVKGYRNQREMVCILYGLRKDRFAANSELISDLHRILFGLKEEGTELFLAVGKMVSTQNEIADSFKSACRSLEELFFCGYGRMVYVRNDVHVSGRPMEAGLKEKCIRFLANYEFEKAQGCLKEIFHQLKTERSIGADQIREYYFKLYYALYQAEHEEEGHSLNYMEGLWRKIRGQDTLCQLHDDFSRELDKKINPFHTQNAAGTTVFALVKKINQEYSNADLNVMWLAETVYLTPAYISNIFKKEMKMTIGQYITQVRIAAAKKYLKDKSLKLYQVAERCGYSDPNYFAKIFRKYTGMTPSEYRGKRE